MRLFLWIYLLSFSFVSVAFSDGYPTRSIQTFERAKKKLYEIPFNTDFYCGCPYNNKLVVDIKGCGFKPDRKSVRTNRIEAEHVVPASHFGRTFKEYWTGHKKCKTAAGKLYSGRQCLLKISAEFKMMHNDLFNLKPAIGIANGDRSDIPYGVVEAPNRYSGCEFKWSPEAVEPRDEVKGDIARIYFYMMETYPSRISIDQRFYTMLVLWSNIDPVDDKECEVERWIFAIQGNRNKFVYDHCKRR